jgi:hypothetical protein
MKIGTHGYRQSYHLILTSQYSLKIEWRSSKQIKIRMLKNKQNVYDQPVSLESFFEWINVSDRLYLTERISEN